VSVAGRQIKGKQQEMPVELGIHSLIEALTTTLPNYSSAVLSPFGGFTQFEDLGYERARLHDLTYILILSVFAVIAGAEGWEDRQEYGETRKRFYASM